MKLRNHQLEALDKANKINEGIIHLPTGCGKTNIEAYLCVNNLEKGRKWAKGIPVFVILTPRILLTNQLYNTIKDLLINENKDCQYLIVHSGKTKDDNRNYSNDIPFRQLESTTSSNEIANQYNRAVRENVPLIIFGTYDSSYKIIKAEIPIYMLMCDEAHHLVSEEFNWIANENEENTPKQFNAYRKYYFTATLRVTRSDEGIGMNNSSLFGPIIYSKTPLEMRIAGEIVGPRTHLVNIIDYKSTDFKNDTDKDVIAIIDTFREHKVNCNVGAKLLVITKGSEHLNDLVLNKKMQNFLNINPNLKIFDISSAYKPRINGIEVKREEFLEKLQNLNDADEAIIFHINILSEGIDVPGITGIMPMNSMGLSKFLQTLGRATRLHKIDREKLYNKTLLYNQLEKFVKPYAWIIIPIYGTIGKDEKERLTDIIDKLRNFGFNAAEDIVIKQIRGSAIPQPLAGINELDTRAKNILNEVIEIEHIIEEKEKAKNIAIEDFRFIENIKNISDNELINLLVSMLERKRSKDVIKEILKRSEDNHNVFTPFELCDEMLNKINIESKYNILVMFNLEFIYVIKEKYENLDNVWFLTSDEFKKNAAIKLGIEENKILMYSYNKKILNTNMPKFDVIVGNPPFQPPTKSIGAGTGSRNKIWHKFIEIGFNCLNYNGIIAFITPFNWRMSNLKKGVEKNAQKLMWENNILEIKNVNDYFDVGQNVTIDYWIITKDKNIKGLEISEVFKKIMFYPLNNKDILEKYFYDYLNESEFYEINIKDNRSYDFNCITKSINGDNTHIYPHLNTIEQYKNNMFDWYDKKTNGFDNKKVIISNFVNINTEGAFFAVYDEGKIGCGSHSWAYLVNSEKEGKELENFINNSNIIKIIFKESSHKTGFGLNLFLIKKISKSWVKQFNNS